MKEEITQALHKILSIMHFLSAIDAENAVHVDDIAKHVQSLDKSQIEDVLRCCKELGYVGERSGRFYLTFKGILSAISISS
ncbi:MAG: hypothetical protein QE164_01590 [Candidatus Nezhaarchaeota archaeon]|nr:hypothetical protein [Candidatus Nezhaarchaeota archaeon]